MLTETFTQCKILLEETLVIISDLSRAGTELKPGNE